MWAAMFRAWCNWMKARGSWKVISRDGDPYMERYYLLRVGPYALFLHRFWRSDPDGVHDHPWNFWRLIVRGYYHEQSLDGILRRYNAGNLMFSQAERMHAVRIADDMRGEVWTLFFHGKRWRAWGFITNPETGSQWISARQMGEHDPRPMRGWLFPRFVR